MSSNTEWRKWGSTDPYFGVITHEKYRGKNLTDEVMHDFFETGEIHIAHVYEVFKKYFDINFNPQKVLDFGCGTGRLLVPLCRRETEVVGVDISDGMLREAKNNLEKRGFQNALLVFSDGSEFNNKIRGMDFVHSYIVLQHVPENLGQEILLSLLKKLKPGGFGALHFTIGSRRRGLIDLVSAIRNKIPFIHYLFNLIQGKRLLEPRMQMTKYNLSRLLMIFRSFGVGQLIIEHTDHGGHLGVMFYFRLPIE